jgi:hypothetical protein
VKNLGHQHPKGRPAAGIWIRVAVQAWIKQLHVVAALLQLPGTGPSHEPSADDHHGSGSGGLGGDGRLVGLIARFDQTCFRSSCTWAGSTGPSARVRWAARGTTCSWACSG